MSDKTGKTSKLAAFVLIGVNLLVMVVCALIFGLSLWMISSPSSLTAAVQGFGNATIKALLSPETLTLAVGLGLAGVSTFLFFVAFMGLYGAVGRSPFLLFMYSMLVLLLLLLECALLYYFSSSLIEKGLQHQDGQWTHALRTAFKCCEYNVTLPQQLSKIPWSCCGPDYYPENCTINAVFNKNCKEAIPAWLHRYQTAIYASLAVLHILLSSCSLLRRTRSMSRSYS